MRSSGCYQTHVSALPCLRDLPARRALAGGPGNREVLVPGPHALFTVTFHQQHCAPPKALCGMGRQGPTLSFLASQAPATLSLSFKAMSQPLDSSLSLGAHRSALSLPPSLEGPSRKACRCPQSPGAQDPLIGHPRPRPPQALRSSFAWPWSCPHGNRRSGSDKGSRRRKTSSGSCGSHSQSTEH